MYHIENNFTQTLIKQPRFSATNARVNSARRVSHTFWTAYRHTQTMAEFKHIVRILNTDIDGRKHVLVGLRKLHGVDFMYANAACKLAGVNRFKKAGDLTDAEAQKLETVIRDGTGIPTWLKNRRKDPYTGEDKHIFGTDLDLTADNDIKILKKTRSYRGVRHMHGQPTRGQRTKSNFRKNKGKHSKNKKR